MDVDHEIRRGLTFAQAEGVEPLPQQLALREISQECSAALWAVIHESFAKSLSASSISFGGSYTIGEPWQTIMRVWHVARLQKYIDEFDFSFEVQRDIVKKLVTSKNYLVLFSFIQFLIQRSDIPAGLARDIGKILESTRLSYRVFDGMIVPISSDEQAVAIQRSLTLAAASAAKGPSAHLKSASVALSAGQWADCVRESITAVEGAAKAVETTAETLGVALSKLKTTIGLNPAMSAAFKQLYGYSSDKQGIRHAQVFDNQPDVNERDAMFMFGACAAFVGYLLSASKS